MTFSDYMNEWLYGEDGYYSHYRSIGKEGDFYTAVSTSKFFGGAIANFLIRRIEEGHLSKHLTLCEIGAHKGYLLADMIEFIYTLKPELLDTISFVIVERYEHLRIKQKAYFEESFGDAVSIKQIASLDELNVEEAFFVANEIFDAFSCDLLHKGKTAIVKDHKILFEAEDESVLERAKKYDQVGGEVAVGFEDFAKSMSNAAKKSEFVTFDYGDVTVRNDFSVRIYEGHEVYPLFDEKINLAKLFKQSDITFDVNFSHLADAYKEAGFDKVAFMTQLKALIEFGILDLLEMVEKNAGFEAYTYELTKVKTLIDPSVMGERFKMIHFKKGD
ncbi:MAG: SAM-dependent methyltransferase [Thiovulaceae bacterium]|nr:SAM-dependent methyltransferase [Sulfurimonadaceae bacterium]